MPSQTDIFIAIETLLRASGNSYCSHLVSVVEEANNYCYKTFDGVIGIVNKDFIHDRCKRMTKNNTFCQNSRHN